MGIEKQQYDKPTFTVYFSSNGYEHKISFVDGSLTYRNINPNVLIQLVKKTYLAGLIQLERFGPRNIKEIYDGVTFAYNSVRRDRPRDKKTRYTDSFYLNFKKAIAPFYTEITENYKNAIESEIESSSDQATKNQLDVVLKELERENGPNIAEIENERFRSQLIEGFLYGIPAIICIVLIIKKIRS